jgi:hypothetical protein
VLEPVKKNIEKLNGWRFNSLKSVYQLINFSDRGCLKKSRLTNGRIFSLFLAIYMV